MLFLHMVFFSLAYFYASEGRKVQGIKGRNVFLSWTFSNMKKDPILILHNSTPFVRVWLAKLHFISHKENTRLRFWGEKSNPNTVQVTVNIVNVTETDAGNYTVERQWDSEEISDIILLEILDQIIIPRITMFRHNISNSMIVLHCNSSSALTDKVQWKLNGSLIEAHGRYSQNDRFLSILNAKVIDSYDLYTCDELGNTFQSDPYRLTYGPDEIFFNISDTRVQVDEFDNISIICFAACFPPCQILWIETKTKTMSQGPELKLVNLTNDVNYKCHATNPNKNNETTFDTIYIKVKSGASYYTTTAITVGTKTYDFPSTGHFLYAGLGMGIMLVVGLFGCLLHKLGACSRVDATSINISLRHSTIDCGQDNLEEETQFQNYWTIVSNAKGDLRTVIERNVKQSQKVLPVCTRTFHTQNISEPSISANDVYPTMNIEAYIDPVHSHSMESDLYIHPVHSDLVLADSSQKRYTL